MMHRMDPVEPGWTVLPVEVRPMLATPAGGLAAFDGDGRVSRRVLDARLSAPASRSSRTSTAVHYLAVDVLWLDGVSTVDLRYLRRRRLLLDLGGRSAPDGLRSKGPVAVQVAGPVAARVARPDSGQRSQAG